MPFDYNNAPIAIPARIQGALRKEWAFLAAPGTWWSGAERVAIAAEARAAMEALPAGNRRDQAVADERSSSRPTTTDDLQPDVRAVVGAVAAESPLITAEWVAGLEGKGVSLPAYAEIIGIVARLSAVDLFHRALGLPPEPLPEAESGEPSRTPPPADLVVGKSYVPMVRGVSIPQTVSLVPPETVAWQALSNAMYMTFNEMDDPDFRRAIHRTQIELVAARTSQINECFY